MLIASWERRGGGLAGFDEGARESRVFVQRGPHGVAFRVELRFVAKVLKVASSAVFGVQTRSSPAPGRGDLDRQQRGEGERALLRNGVHAHPHAFSRERAAHDDLSAGKARHAFARRV
jgi:hypothetical protein